MNKTAYMTVLRQRLGTYFDILENGVYENRTYDLAAVFSSREDQTVLFRENVMDYLESKELLLVTSADSGGDIAAELGRLPETVLRAARPSRHHKSTVLTRVFVTETACTPETVRRITGFRFSRAFRFWLWGWVEVRTVLADLSDGTVYTNHAAHSHRKSFVPGTAGNSTGSSTAVCV